MDLKNKKVVLKRNIWYRKKQECGYSFHELKAGNIIHIDNMVKINNENYKKCILTFQYNNHVNEIILNYVSMNMSLEIIQ